MIGIEHQGFKRVAISSGLFFTIFLVLYSCYQWAELYLQHYFNWLASSVAAVIALFDKQVGAEGNLILYQDVPTLRVVEGCDGVTVFILIIAAVMAFPKPLKQRLVGVLVLVPVLFAINWLRLFILADIRFYLPEYFRIVHVYVFQPAMIFATFICFIVWITYDGRSSGKKAAY